MGHSCKCIDGFQIAADGKSCGLTAVEQARRGGGGGVGVGTILGITLLALTSVARAYTRPLCSST
jgi:hypothetical protein